MNYNIKYRLLFCFEKEHEYCLARPDTPNKIHWFPKHRVESVFYVKKVPGGVYDFYLHDYDVHYTNFIAILKQKD